MLLSASALKGYAILASDGAIGTVTDFLFDDRSWKIRWLVVDTGSWLSGQKVLVHPSRIGAVDLERRNIGVRLTKADVEGSPDSLRDQPVSQQMEQHLFDYYGCDPFWGTSYFVGTGANGSPLASAPFFGAATAEDTVEVKARTDNTDPHLRSIDAVSGYHIHASDGEIGHVEDFLLDTASWGILYLVADTRNWWVGKHVLLSPFAVRDIRWPDRQIRLALSRAKVRSSPEWDPAKTVELAYQQLLHTHYGWPGYGF